MSQPKEKHGKLYCPNCGKEVTRETVQYPEITEGVFRAGKTWIETAYKCNRCGYEYLSKELQ